jgi:GWxTD domain-containing protein
MGPTSLLGLVVPLLLAPPRTAALPFRAELLPIVDDREVKVRVFVGVQYDDLQFLKTDEGYAARFRVSVEAVDEERRVALAKDWESEKRLSDYNLTASPGRWRTTCRTLQLEPGRYRITIQVKDLASGLCGQRDKGLDVGLAGGDEVEVSALVVEKGSGRCGKTRPFWGERKPEAVSLVWQLWSAEAESAVVDVAVVDGKQDTLFHAETLSPVGGPLQRTELTELEFPPGVLSFRVQARAGHRKGSWERAFRVGAWGVPTEGKTLDAMVEQMRAVMDPDAYEQVVSLSPSEKKAAFEEFWTRRDPTPDTEENELLAEFFGRVEIVEREFSYGDWPGCDTDRGRIYLVYGRPDERKRFTSGRFQEKVHEVWRYYRLRRRFVFVDELGAGNFVLVSSS